MKVFEKEKHSLYLSWFIVGNHLASGLAYKNSPMVCVPLLQSIDFPAQSMHHPLSSNPWIIKNSHFELDIHVYMYVCCVQTEL